MKPEDLAIALIKNVTSIVEDHRVIGAACAIQKLALEGDAAFAGF
jgi:hypothetical protein